MRISIPVPRGNNPDREEIPEGGETDLDPAEELVNTLDECLPEGSMQGNPQALDDELISDSGRLHDSGKDVGQPTRRSNRKIKPPSRFVNAVMVGLQLGKLLYTQPLWSAMTTLQELPGTKGIVLEQDFTSFNFLSKPEVTKLRELYLADSFTSE